MELTAEAKRAHSALHKARQGTTTPCEALPFLYDAKDEEETPRLFMHRANQAADMCWDCPFVMKECREVRLSDQTLEGMIVAGEVSWFAEEITESEVAA